MQAGENSIIEDRIHK